MSCCKGLLTELISVIHVLKYLDKWKIKYMYIKLVLAIKKNGPKNVWPRLKPKSFKFQAHSLISELTITDTIVYLQWVKYCSHKMS